MVPFIFKVTVKLWMHCAGVPVHFRGMTPSWDVPE